MSPGDMAFFAPRTISDSRDYSKAPPPSYTNWQECVYARLRSVRRGIGRPVGRAGDDVTAAAMHQPLRVQVRDDALLCVGLWRRFNLLRASWMSYGRRSIMRDVSARNRTAPVPRDGPVRCSVGSAVVRVVSQLCLRACRARNTLVGSLAGRARSTGQRFCVRSAR